jgi:hypothetical protein
MTTRRHGDIVRPAHFRQSRPSEGYCLLDFYEVWLWQAIHQQRNSDKAYEYARTLGHWALLMHPDLAPEPRNVVRGEN